MNQKTAALDFLRLAAKGEAREAFRRFVGPDFIHHNAYFKGDGNTLMVAMDEAAKAHPETSVDVKHAVEEDDIVSVHSHVRHKPSDRGFAISHIFRFENGRIAELWDFGQEIPENMINENGMF
jgi:predicted SnoaL-like aldol condensation-catalyzing enzyme